MRHFAAESLGAAGLIRRDRARPVRRTTAQNRLSSGHLRIGQDHAARVGDRRGRHRRETCAQVGDVGRVDVMRRVGRVAPARAEPIAAVASIDEPPPVAPAVARLGAVTRDPVGPDGAPQTWQ